jgi:hypothetical protein
MKVTMPDERQKPEDGFDPLDELLAKAQWPESPLATQRLEQHWRSISSRGTRSIQWSGIAAVAALLIVAIGIWRWPQANPPSPEMPRLSPIALAAPEVSINAGRPATNIELAMLRVLSRQQQAARPVANLMQGVSLVPLVTGWSVAEQSHPRPAPIAIAPPQVSPTLLAQQIVSTTDAHQRDRLLDDLVAQGPDGARAAFFNLLADQSTAAAATAAICRHPIGWTDALFAALGEPRIAVRLGAANALAEIDGPVITNRLIKMADTGVNRPEAVTALVQIQSTDARRFVAAAMRSPDLSGYVRSAIAQNSANQFQTGVLQ